MNVHDLIYQLEAKFPLWIQEEYDNTGAQIIFPDEDVKGIYICLDADMITIEDAIEKKCNLILSHHPLIFKAIKAIDHSESRSKSIIKLIENKISLFSLHTNFDKIMFSYLSDIAGFEGGKLLLKKGNLNDEPIGYGTFVNLNYTITLNSLMDRIKESLGLDNLIYSGNYNAEINTIAFINGSGGSSIETIIKSLHPDCIVTGDVGYHNAKYAIDNNVCVIDAGHFGTENIFKKLLAESINDIITVNNHRITIVISDIEKNPFNVY